MSIWKESGPSLQEFDQTKAERNLQVAALYERSAYNKLAVEQRQQLEEILRDTEIGYLELVQALSVFSGDLGLVHSHGEQPTSILDEPLEQGQYWLTTALEEEDDFLETLAEKIAGKQVVLVIQCMDKDGAKLTFESFREQYADDSDHVVLPLSIGGGIAQQDIVSQSVLKNTNLEFPAMLQVNRKIALYVVLRALEVLITQAGGTLDTVHCLTHNCRCGACAFYNDGVGVPEQLGTHLGSEEENREMLRRAKEGAQELIEANVVSATVSSEVADFGDQSPLAGLRQNRQYVDRYPNQLKDEAEI